MLLCDPGSELRLLIDGERKRRTKIIERDGGKKKCQYFIYKQLLIVVTEGV